MKVRILLVSLLFIATAEFAKAVEIECQYVDGDWNDLGSLYTCSGTIVSVGNPSTVTIISGHHNGGRNNEDVKGFAIAGDRTLITIPQGIAEFFSNLEALEWINGDIKTIDSSIFEPFTNLLHINLATNNIVELDGDLFQHSSRLRVIYFYNNQIYHVGLGLLTGLTDLTSANFRSNPCIDLWATTPEEMRELKNQLPIRCPPLITCPSTCTLLDEFEDVKLEVAKLQQILLECHCVENLSNFSRSKKF